MGILKDVNRDDLLNRFSDHTFVETTIGSMTKVEFKNASSVVVAEATKISVDDAYRHVRAQMVDGGDIIIGNFTFQGQTKFGGSTAISPNGAIDIVGNSLETARVRNIRYQAGVNAAAVIQVGHSRGSEASPTALNSGDRLGSYIFIGNDGNAAGANGPAIRAKTTEDWTGTKRGSKIEIFVVKTGTNVQILALTLSENGFPVAPIFTMATLPPVEAGGQIDISDETGGYTPAFSDGTNWRRFRDSEIVAA